MPNSWTGKVRLEIIAILFLLWGTSCQGTANQKVTPQKGPYAHLENEKVKEVLKKAIDWGGGIAAWNSLDSIYYAKQSRLLLEDGSIESEVHQQHAYAMLPMFTATIDWTEDNQAHQLVYTSDQAVKYVDKLKAAEGEQVKKSVFSSLYVLGMPFKLLDAGVHLSYEGKVTIASDEAHVIKATYDPSSNDNHSTQDVWWYYFEVTSGKFLSCMVHHPPTYAYIENLAFHNVDGIRFHHHRKSYRSDSLRNKQFLRAEFWYDGYQLTFRKPSPIP